MNAFPVRSGPVLQVDCLILHSAGPTSPLAYPRTHPLDCIPLTPYTYVKHNFFSSDMQRWHWHIGTVLGPIIATYITVWAADVTLWATSVILELRTSPLSYRRPTHSYKRHLLRYILHWAISFILRATNFMCWAIEATFWATEVTVWAVDTYFALSKRRHILWAISLSKSNIDWRLCPLLSEEQKSILLSF